MPNQSPTPKIDPDGLQRLVRAYRGLQNLKPKDLKKKWEKVLLDSSKKEALSWLIPKKEGKPFDGADLITKLEEQKIPTGLELYQVRPLSEIYSIPTLMLPPLLAKPHNTDGLSHSIYDFIEAEELKAKHSTYKVFAKRLAKTDAVFVQLHLGKGGKADVHRHPGDELIYVRDGEVTFHVRSLGYRPRLKKGDIIHFHADLEHTASADRNCDLFIIRFFQLGGGGIRAAMHERFNRFINAMQGSNASGDALVKLRNVKKKFKEIEPWLRQITESPPPFVEEPNKITDRVGLSHLLSRIPEFKGTNGYLYSLKRGTGPADATIQHIFSLSNHLNNVCKVKYPPNLFSSFIFPRVPNVVILRKGEDDFCDLSSINGFESNDKAVRYLTPRFNLVGSDVALNLIEIPPNKSTAYNQHPGFELAFPIDGQIKVEFEAGSSWEANSKRGEYVHYSSDQPHRVTQVGDELARVLVVRFFEYASLHLDRAPRGRGDASERKHPAPLGPHS